MYMYMPTSADLAGPCSPSNNLIAVDRGETIQKNLSKVHFVINSSFASLHQDLAFPELLSVRQESVKMLLNITTRPETFHA